MTTSNKTYIPAAILLALALTGCSDSGEPDPFDDAEDRTATGVLSDASPALHAPGEPHAYDNCDGSVCVRSGPALLHSGEFEEVAVDLRVPGVGLDFVWVRRYRSRIGIDSSQGAGWDFSYNIFIEDLGRGTVRIHDGFNQSADFKADRGGTYTADGFHREGRYDASGAFVVTFADGGTWHFRSNTEATAPGRIDTITDRNGNTLHFAYDAASRLETVTDTLGRPFTVGYDAQGHIASVTDFTGRQVTYGYYQDGDATGRADDLATVTLPAIVGTSTGNDFPAGRTTHYEYDAGSTEPELAHNLLAVTNARGDRITENTYGTTGLELDRLVVQAYGGPDNLVQLAYLPMPSPVGLGVQTWVNDAEGLVTAHTFDGLGREVSRRVYDERADRLAPSDPTTNLPSGPSFDTTFEYNRDHHLVSIQRPSGVRHEMVYETGAARRRGNIVALRIVARDGTSTVERFEYDPRFGNEHPGHEFATMTTDATLVWSEQAFDAAGNRVSLTNGDPDQTQTWTYDARGRISEHVGAADAMDHRMITHWSYYGPTDGFQEGYHAQRVEDDGGLGLTTQWTYDELGRAIERVDPRGGSVLREFNAADQIVREWAPERNGVRAHDDRRYDAMMGLVGVSYLVIDDMGLVDPDNPTIDVEYSLDVFGNETEIRDELEDGVMRVAKIEYDRNQNMIEHRSVAAVAGQTPAEISSYTWGGRGEVSRTEGVGSTDALVTTFVRDDDGRIVERHESGSMQVRVTRMDYDDWDRVIATTDPMGNVTRVDHDEAGRITRLRHEGELVDAMGSAGNVLLTDQTFEYDGTGRQNGSQRAWFDPATGPSTMTVAESQLLDGTGHPFAHTDARGATSYRYEDTAGRALSSYDPVGNEVHVTRDPEGYPVHRERRLAGPEGQTIATLDTMFDLQLDRIGEVSATGATRGWRHDSRTNVRSRTDGRAGSGTHGNEIRYEHDAVGRELRTRYQLTDDGTGGGTPDGELVVEFEYDDAGRIVAQTDPLGHTTTLDYDDRGRLAARHYPDGTIETFEYDAFGDRIEEVDAAGNRVNYTRDALGRVTDTAIVPAGATSTEAEWESFAYDGMGHVVRAADADSTVTRRYDSLGNLVEESVNGLVTEASYDAYGKLETLELPSGEVVDYVRDGAGRITSVEHDGVQVAELAYRGPSAIASRAFPEAGLHSTFGHDARGAVISVEHELGGTVVESLTYTRDAEGLVEQAQSTAGHGARVMAHDSVGRTTDATQTDPAVGVSAAHYEYDANGNWASVSGRADGCNGTFTVDSLTNRYDATPCEQLSYDSAGSLTSIVSTNTEGRDRTYVYDARRRLIEVIDTTAAGDVTTTLGYDALGRVHTTTQSQPGPTGGPVVSVRQRAYLGQRDVEHVVDGQALDYVFDDNPWGHALLRIDAAAGQRMYFGDDALGSTILAVAGDATGAWTSERVIYGDYGQPMFESAAGVSDTSALGLQRLFAGMLWHSGIGLYETQTRMLDPRLGRFVSVDRGGRWDDATAFGNGYVYAGSQPHTSIDPTGRWKTPTYYNGWSSTERSNLQNWTLGRAQSRAFELRSQTAWVMTAFANNHSRYYVADNLSAWFGGWGCWACASELRYSARYTHNRMKSDTIVFKHRSTGWCTPGGKSAWTTPDRHGWIRICRPQFWSFTSTYVPRTPASKAYTASWASAPGTVVHEAYHNAGIAVGDKRYATDGIPNTLRNNGSFQWPNNNPYRAKHNADTYENAALDCAFGLGTVRCQ